MEKILVPTDFSELAFRACEVAVQYAKRTNAWVYLLHVEPKKSADTNIANQRLEELKMHEVFSGVNVSTIYKQSKLEGSIISSAKEHKIDLIIMGSHGKGAKNSGLVGSNTARVVRLSEFPVLVVKSKEEEYQGNNIVFASSFYGEVDQVFEKIKQIAEACDGHLYLLKVITPRHFETTKQSNELISSFAKKHRLKNYSVHTYNHETKEQGIMEFAQETNADLIALVTHGRKGLSQYLLGSIAEQVADNSNIPVLSVKLPPVKPTDAILFPD